MSRHAVEGERNVFSSASVFCHDFDDFGDAWLSCNRTVKQRPEA
jgi:hypothetical protein